MHLFHQIYTFIPYAVVRLSKERKKGEKEERVKEENREGREEKRQITYKGTPISLTADFSAETL